MAKWIYDGDCMITSCCNAAYDIDKFERKGELIYVPCECPNCGARMKEDGDTRNLTDEETDIYNSRLEAEAETIDRISLL